MLPIVRAALVVVVGIGLAGCSNAPAEAPAASATTGTTAAAQPFPVLVAGQSIALVQQLHAIGRASIDGRAPSDSQRTSLEGTRSQLAALLAQLTAGGSPAPELKDLTEAIARYQSITDQLLGSGPPTAQSFLQRGEALLAVDQAWLAAMASIERAEHVSLASGLQLPPWSVEPTPPAP